MESIGVIDFGGQYTHLIARRIRALGVHSEVIPINRKAADLPPLKGLIFSGGPASVYAQGAPQADPDLLNLGIPVLGLCYGHQWISRALGGNVSRGKIHEFGKAHLKPEVGHPLFDTMSEAPVVWMSHGDEVSALPEGFRVIGTTPDCSHAAVADDTRQIYGVQFHPEVTHTPEGEKLFRNFLKICECSFDWKVADQMEAVSERLRIQCAGKKVFLLVSGGVDSTVAFDLLNKALGPERVLGLHIDNGLMRKNESAEVLEFMQAEGFSNLRILDASEKFLAALEGVSGPEEKRHAIGETFLTAKDEAIAALSLDPSEWLLAQGTIYPDTIESGGTQDAAVIKTHHNRVQGILDLMAQGLIVEPLADFYKDEVRELGALLGIPDPLLSRHPFPGPGLGVRLLCNSKPDTGAPEVEAEFQALLPGTGYRGQVLPVRSVGVQGDARTYAHPGLLQGPLHWDHLETLATDLPNRVRGINRVVWEVGCKGNESYLPVHAFLTRTRLDFLREVDAALTSLLRESHQYAKVWQMPVVLLPVEYGGLPVAVMRPVESSEAMTARFSALPPDVVAEAWQRAEALGCGALLYDVTHKPPGTIEGE
jgi:GMP synthase (glutamine-hydrolysing)